MLKQTCKLLFIGMLLTFANHGLLNTAARASTYSDIRVSPTGSDQLAAEAVSGPATAGTPPNVINIPAETWTADFRYWCPPDTKKFGTDNVFNGTGPTGVMINGSAKTKTINTKSKMVGYHAGQECSYQYTYHFVLHDMQTGAANPQNSPCPQQSYIL